MLKVTRAIVDVLVPVKDELDRQREIEEREARKKQPVSAGVNDE
jgi:hypothetical protein